MHGQKNIKLGLSCLSVRPSVCRSVRLSDWKNSAPIGRMFMKFDIRIFFENLSKKFKFH